MDVLARSLPGATAGVLLGAVVIAIASGLTVVTSYFTQTAQRIPSVFEAAWAQSGHAVELYFRLDFAGMLAVIGLCGMAVMVCYLLTNGRQRR